MIPWQDFLNLLERQAVHLAALKSHFAQDIFLTADTQIFATSIDNIDFQGKSKNIAGENTMMGDR